MPKREETDLFRMYRLLILIKSMKSLGKNLYLLFGLSLVFWQAISLAVLPRVVIALYDKNDKPFVYRTLIHKCAEMPLNYLGLDVQYYEISEGYPDVKNDDNIIGVISWFPNTSTIQDPKGYFQLALDTMNAGKSFVQMGQIPSGGGDRAAILREDFWKILGLKLGEPKTILHYLDLTTRYADPLFMNFEREFLEVYNNIPNVQEMTGSGQVIMSAINPDNDQLDIIIAAITKNGAYIAEGFAFYQDLEVEPPYRAWYINPFNFFRAAFKLDNRPAPDTTTLAGNRIYYSHIDGDGWLSVSQVEKYQKEKLIAAEVLYREILLPYSDLPVTVSPIAAELNLDWVGTPTGQAVARKIFRLPNVEMGSHTYSHPFHWGFFEDYRKEYERPYLEHFSGPVFEKISLFGRFFFDDIEKDMYRLSSDYDIPRGYAAEPFTLDLEVQGSIDEINKFAPEGKKVEVYQWSGDTSPWEGAIKATRVAHVFNINGGDSRFDRVYNSYSYLSPIGRRVGDELQIYSSNSNENTYTDLWRDRFFGFNLLPETLHSTNAPFRTHPINLYYHTYSVEKNEGLNALISNLEYILEQEIIPIKTSEYTSIAEGFYTTKIDKISDALFEISDRGSLQTIRFDLTSDRSVDFVLSKGVIGQRHLNGSLYVYLDASEKKPQIALKKVNPLKGYPIEKQPYLEKSRWKIWHVKQKNGSLTFAAEGFGEGQMLWQSVHPGKYIVNVTNGRVLFETEVNVGMAGQLFLNLPPIALNGVYVTIKKMIPK